MIYLYYLFNINSQNSILLYRSHIGISLYIINNYKIAEYFKINMFVCFYKLLINNT